MTEGRAAAWGRALPGLALAGILGGVAVVASDIVGSRLPGFGTSPISPVLVVVFLGLLLSNTITLPEAVEPGLALAVRRLLRIGVALLGIRLSLIAAATIGAVALPIALVCIAAALLFVTALSRLLGLPPRLGSLIAAGTSICGISAIVAVTPALDADEDEVSYAVGTIAIFGMVALFAYPFLASLLFDGSTQAGLFLGTAIHDTSQVVGAGIAYAEQYGAPEALDTAVVTKLVRNLCMVGVLPLLGLLHASRAPTHDGPQRPVIPLFVIGFVAMALLRTAGDAALVPAGLLPDGAWNTAVSVTEDAAGILLLLAMAAVGLGTRFANLRALGFRPLTVGFAAALVVGVVSVSLIKLVTALSLI